MEGFRAASAFVEVSAKVNDAEVLDAARRAAEVLDKRLRSGVESTGDEITRILSDAGDKGGKGLATRAEGQIRNSRRRFVSSGSEIGDGLGTAAATSFGASLTKNMPAALGPAMTPVAVLLAPTIAATLGAAVIGGAAGLGIVGGVVMAARDPRIKAAGASLGEFILGDLEDRSAKFLPVVADAIGEIRHAWIGMGPDIDRIFNSSRLLEPLVDGMVDGGRKLVHGIADAVDKAGPVIDAFGRSFDAIGESVGDFFTTIGENADEGASALDEFTGAFTRMIDTGAALVEAGSAVKGWTNELDVALDKGRYWIEDNSDLAEGLKSVGVNLDMTADGFAKGSKEAEAYRKATIGTADASDFATLKLAGMKDVEIANADASGTFRQKIGEVNEELGRTPPKVEDAIGALRDWYDALDEMTDSNLKARKAQRDLEAAIDGATEAIEKNGITAINHGTALDINSAKGRDNAAALDKIAAGANGAYEAILAQTGSQDLANAAADRGRAQFIALAHKMGLSMTAARTLADSLIRIKDRRVVVTADTKPALTAAQNLVSRINNMKARIGVGAYGTGSFGGGKNTGFGNSAGMAGGGAVTGGSGFRDDVPILAMGGEWMIKKPARHALERTFGAGIMDRLNNWDTGRTPARPDRVDPMITAIGGINRNAAESAGPPAPVPSTGPRSSYHFAPGAFTVDVSRIKDVGDLVRLVQNLTQTARAMGAAA